VVDDLRGVSQEMAAWQVEPSDFEISSSISTALDEHIHKQESVPKSHRRSAWLNLSWRRVLGWSFVGTALILMMIAGSTRYLMRSKQAGRFVREQEAAKPEKGSFYYYWNAKAPSAPDQTRSSPGFQNVPRTTTDYARDLNGSEGTLGKLEKEQRRPVSGKRGELAIPTGPMVIRTAELALTAKDFEQARSRME